MLGPQSSKEDASLLAKFREHPDATGEADTSTEDGGPNECDLVLKGGITSGLRPVDIQTTSGIPAAFEI
jgi:hypothetical protein